MDVVCAVKRYASDESPSQQPVLVLPAISLQRLPSPVPTARRPFHPLSVDRRLNWAALAKTLLTSLQQDPDVYRTVRYLLKAAEGESLAMGPGSPLTWHGARHDPNLIQLRDAPPTTFLKLFPVAKFRATLKR